jgi:hypothetical protein
MRIFVFTGLTILILSACSVRPDTGSGPAPLAEATALPADPTPLPTPTPLPAMRVTAADESFFVGYYDDARSGYQQALAEADDAETQSAALLGLIKTAYEEGNCEAVIQSHQQIIAQFPGTQPAALSNFFAGKCFESLQDYATAAAAYSSLQSARPGIIDDYLFELIGDSFSNAGDSLSAISAYPPSLRIPLAMQISSGSRSAKGTRHLRMIPKPSGFFLTCLIPPNLTTPAPQPTCSSENLI